MLHSGENRPMRAVLRLIPVISCLLSAPALAGPLEDGRAKLFARDFAGAESDFTLAIATPPADDDEAAHAFRSAARIARFLDDEGAGDPGEIDSLKELLELFAFPSDQRSVLDGSIDPPRDAEHRLDLPPDSPRGAEVQGFFAGPLLAAIDASLADLAAVSPSYATTVTGAEVVQLLDALDHSVPNVSEDLVFAAGEWKLWETGLHLARAALLFSYAYDLDVDLDEVLDPDFVLAIQANVLDPDPSLGTLAPDGAAILLDARDALLAAIGAYESASAAIRASDDCCFLSYGERHLDWEERLRSRLADLRTSLLTCAPFEYNSKIFGESQFQPCALLGGGPNPPISPRTLLPPVLYDSEYDPRNFVDGCDADPTWGGLFPLGGVTPTVLAGGHLRPCGALAEDALRIERGLTEGFVSGSYPMWYRYTTVSSGPVDLRFCVDTRDSDRVYTLGVAAYAGYPHPSGQNLIGTFYAVNYPWLGNSSVGESCGPITTREWYYYYVVPVVPAGTAIWIGTFSYGDDTFFSIQAPEPGSGAIGFVAIGVLGLRRGLRRRR
jgi:hypothetical protein